MRSGIVELQRCGIITCKLKEEEINPTPNDEESEATIVTEMELINDNQVPLYQSALMEKYSPNAAGAKLLTISERCKVYDRFSSTHT